MILTCFTCDKNVAVSKKQGQTSQNMKVTIEDLRRFIEAKAATAPYKAANRHLKKVSTRLILELESWVKCKNRDYLDSIKLASTTHSFW